MLDAVGEYLTPRFPVGKTPSGNTTRVILLPGVLVLGALVLQMQKSFSPLQHQI